MPSKRTPNDTAADTANAGVPTAVASSPRRRRLKRNALPQVSGAEVPYANCRPVFKAMSDGEKAVLIRNSQSWHDVMRPYLDLLEQERSPRGGGYAYTVEELELLALYKLMTGSKTYSEARAKLSLPESARCRTALGLDRTDRRRVGRYRDDYRSLPGLPSVRTMSRHMTRWDADRRAKAYEELFERIVREHIAEFPTQLKDEVRLLLIDGSDIHTRRSPYPRTVTRIASDGTRTTDELPPTLVGGGFRAADTPDKRGKGFQLVTAVTESGLPVAARITPMNENEGQVGEALLNEDFARNVAPFLDKTQPGVIVADSAYSSTGFRAAAARQNYVPNTHPVSHAQSDRSTRHARTRNNDRYQIEGHEHWHANGHREIFCDCGHQATKETYKPVRNGISINTSGACEKCGHISITSGLWRVSRNPNKFVRARPGEERDFSFGNPLTFNSPRARDYGRARFSRNEGFHAVLATRFRLIDGPQAYRTRTQASTDVHAVFCLMHALAMHERAHASGGAATPPGHSPPLALAA